MARAHFRKKKKKKTPQPETFTPLQVAALYGFPSDVTGTGQTIGIIELGGGFSATDLKTYFKSVGVKAPSVTAVSVDGGTNTPGGEADGEHVVESGSDAG